MQNFIVLGIIPGTHYQTTFLFWLWVALSLPIAYLMVSRWHTLHAYFIARKIARFIDHYEYMGFRP